MASFGESLRREREMRGVTLQEISATTKISVRFLEALEAEDFAKLPGGIFTRSFIRAYAGFLGLDQERTLAEYHLVAPSQDDADLSRMGTSKRHTSQKSSPTAILTWALVVVMMAGGYGLFRYSHRTPDIQLKPPTAAQASAPPAAVPATSSSQGSVVSREALPAITNASPAGGASSVSSSSQSGGNPGPLDAEKSQADKVNRSAPQGAASPDAWASGHRPADESASKAPKLSTEQPGSQLQGLTAQAAALNTKGPLGEGDLLLQVAATERAWVAVEADGKTLLQRVLNPNEVRTLKARDSFKVTTGNAQGIVLTLNGETLKPLGRRGEVKSLLLTHDDLKNPSP